MWKRLTVIWVLVRGDARRLWFALRHPAAPRWLKPATALLLLYLVSPLDLVPDALPVVGLVDDLVLLPLAVRWMLSMLPAALRGEIHQRFGASAGGPPPGAGRGFTTGR
jgi:uncharacterized membrane protein YkvA (DUF1232 family)